MTKTEYREHMVRVLQHIQARVAAFYAIAVDDYVVGVDDRIRVFPYSDPEMLMTPKEFVSESMRVRPNARLDRNLTVTNHGQAHAPPDMPSPLRKRIAEELDALTIELSEGPLP